MADIKPVYRQTSDSYTITVTNKSDGSVFNLDGYTTYFTVKRKKDNNTADTSALISKNVTSLPTSNTARISVTTADTSLGAGVYIYDIIISNGTTRLVVVEGNYEVEDTVTNR